jgi:hypothetical protein
MRIRTKKDMAGLKVQLQNLLGGTCQKDWNHDWFSGSNSLSRIWSGDGCKNMTGDSRRSLTRRQNLNETFPFLDIFSK